ncbi:hypothetical protein [Acetilactobacillus jinshanensis]|uniref:hypothetical protein n=1 Tax=Acetilactobacillus jinshanensis TaxID=1720083 RepID=UPI0013A5F3EE|nr:hypothetical protein [Acetilactobacillus jinshanensis]URL61309.1 hypothetical protein HGK75_04760 [uncultured bacterium]
MPQNWETWLGYIFAGMFGLGALIIFIALIMLIIWFILPPKHYHHGHHRDK